MNVNANFLTWNDELRRLSSYVVLGTAVVTALVAVALWWFLAATPVWAYWVLVGVLALVLAFMAALLFVPVRAAAPAMEQPMQEPAAADAPPGAEATAAPAPPAFEPRVLTLRCGDCGTIFELTDTGERPLYHTCPGCGAEGALRDEPMAAAEASPELAAPEMPAPEAAPEPQPAPELPAEPAPAAPPVKKMKLRCGGCKEVFSIEDSGERPLRRACPHCGRVGQIN